MKRTDFVRLAALLPLLLTAQQQQIEDSHWQEIVAKHKRGEKITEAERDARFENSTFVSVPEVPGAGSVELGQDGI